MQASAIALVTQAVLATVNTPPPPSAPPGGGEPTCKELPKWGFGVGIALNVAGSIGINVGQNVQAKAMALMPKEMRAKPHKSGLWRTGFLCYFLFTILNFASLALAPSSVLTPIESVQFVSNIMFNRFVNKAKISRRMILGVVLAVVGTTVSVVWGPSGADCYSIPYLIVLWKRWAWVFFMAGSLGLAVIAFFGHVAYGKAEKRGRKLWRHDLMRPIMFTISSSIGGGAQMLVHSKVLSTLLGYILQGQASIFEEWILYLALGLAILTGFFWIFRQTQGLGLYDPLVILPLMIGTYILVGGVAGGIFFDEFSTMMHKQLKVWNWPIYGGGMFLVCLGLFLIASAGSQQQAAAVEPTDVFADMTPTQRWQAAGRRIKLQKRLEVLFDHSPAVDPKYTSALMPAPNYIVKTIWSLNVIEKKMRMFSKKTKSVSSSGLNSVQRSISGLAAGAKSYSDDQRREERKLDVKPIGDGDY